MLRRDERIRVEYRGDSFNINGPGIIYWLIHDGFDITTRDGDHGLKWGHEHRWNEGEEYDRRLTVVVHYSRLSRYDPMAKCMESSSAELIASHDTLSSAERAWLADVRLQRMADPDSVSSGDLAKARALDEEALRLAVFEDAGNCAGEPPDDPDRYDDRGPAPPLPLVIGALVAVAGLGYLARRRFPSRDTSRQ